MCYLLVSCSMYLLFLFLNPRLFSPQKVAMDPNWNTVAKVTKWCSSPGTCDFKTAGPTIRPIKKHQRNTRPPKNVMGTIPQASTASDASAEANGRLRKPRGLLAKISMTENHPIQSHGFSLVRRLGETCGRKRAVLRGTAREGHIDRNNPKYVVDDTVWPDVSFRWESCIPHLGSSPLRKTHPVIGIESFGSLFIV